MIRSKTTVYGDKAYESIVAAGYEQIQRATVFLWQKCTEEVNVSNPRPYVTPSQPGEPPRKRTGFGQRNIRYELNKDLHYGRVGIAVNALYMLFLDQGTTFIRPRPWLVATLDKYRAQIKAIAEG
jgi:hypothetical protein